MSARRSITGVFKKAVVTGLAAMTLMAGSAGVAEARGKRQAPPPAPVCELVPVAQQPWHTDLYAQEMDALQRVCEADIRSIRATAQSEKTRTAASVFQGILGSRSRSNDRDRGWEVLKTTSRGNADDAKTGARLISDVARREARFVTEQQRVEDRYKRDYERAHPVAQPSRTTSSTTPQTDEQLDAERVKICQDRDKALLKQGKDFPAGDRCISILRQPKP